MVCRHQTHNLGLGQPNMRRFRHGDQTVSCRVSERHQHALLAYHIPLKCVDPSHTPDRAARMQGAADAAAACGGAPAAATAGAASAAAAAAGESSYDAAGAMIQLGKTSYDGTFPSCVTGLKALSWLAAAARFCRRMWRVCAGATLLPPAHLEQHSCSRELQRACAVATLSSIYFQVAGEC